MMSDDTMMNEDEKGNERKEDETKNTEAVEPASEDADLKTQMSQLKSQLAQLETKLEKFATKTEDKDESEDDDQEKAKKTPQELDATVKRLPIEDWQPLKGFNRPEIRSNVLVVYHKTVTQVSGESEDGKTPKEGPNSEPKDTNEGAAKVDTKEDSSGGFSEEVKKEFMPPPERTTKEAQEESKHSRQKESTQRKEGDIEGASRDEEHGINTIEASRNTDFKQVIQRIQINSRPLLDELEFITGTTMSKTPTVIVPPFKPLVKMRDKIEKELLAKEKAMAAQGRSRDDNPKIGPATEAETRNDTRQRTITQHLRCLLSFIDKDLKDILELRRKVKDATLEKIAFDDLWHLFEPGDLVFSAVDKKTAAGELSYERAFRVHSVTSGRTYMSGRAHITADQPGQQAADQKADTSLTNLTQASAQRNRWPLELGLHYVDTNGDIIGPQTLDPNKSMIQNYFGEKAITDLSFYPARFHKDYSAVMKRLLDRGARFLRMSTMGHRMYNGLTVSTDPEFIQGEVVIDFKYGYALDEIRTRKAIEIGAIEFPITRVEETFELTGCGDHSCLGCTNNYDDSRLDNKLYDEFMMDFVLGCIDTDPNVRKGDISQEELRDFLVLMPREVIGYALRNRTWHYLNVDLIREIDSQSSKEQSGFDELVIDEDNKKLVLALVQNHQTDRNTTEEQSGTPNAEKKNVQNSPPMDLVPGKGKGLVFLLHGAPGVGKTSTAETVAAYTERPLYPITCGDIGQEAVDVERHLQRHFKMAHRWGCVLLLDEADIFLAKRDNKDVHRNALVSVFLRTLEYYSGILFLTTNRVGVIDEAFASRIHVPLYYPPLDERSTKKIWDNSLKKIKRNNKNAEVAIKFDKDTLLDYAVQHFRENSPPPGKDTPSSAWNGRQIRNAFQTALALAHYDRIEKIRKAGVNEAEATTHKRFKKAELKRRHFEQVAAITKNYYDYLKDAHGGKAFEEQAVFNEERADWQPGGSTQPVPQAMPISGFPAGRGFGMMPTRPAVNQQTMPKDGIRASEGKKEKAKKKSKRKSSSSDTEGTERKDKQKKKREIRKKETTSEQSSGDDDSSSDSSSSSSSGEE